jgi:uncharacterized membrane protein YecN with MAPEG domain
MLLQTTLALAAAAVAINVWLFVRCIRLRMNGNVLHGDGGNPLLLQRMRAHSNFTEHAPIFLILVALIEMAHRGGTWLAAVGAVFMIARLLHVFGMDIARPNPLRAAGALVSVGCEIVLAGAALMIALGRL